MNEKTITILKSVFSPNRTLFDWIISLAFFAVKCYRKLIKIRRWTNYSLIKRFYPSFILKYKYFEFFFNLYRNSPGECWLLINLDFRY